MTTARQPARPRLGWALTALRRAIGALRYVHAENVRASEALFRPVRAPQRGQRVGEPSHPVSAAGRPERPA
ncbi:MAG TPA: hypothetical protein VEC76_06705 [Streptosporangiaceae bacterium]|nr:hypothetical protein [Streptosporangiaceae bacterium]